MSKVIPTGLREVKSRAPIFPSSPQEPPLKY
ncbi:hypothetical protein J0S82_003465 [Galemys pyrenaicus]|uniref:Uncharacterized protein n=1 Tax=Galemys pyrenaicus TaxID=202257 RepID=A0A8J6A221_GALPY|nr:hypothetical protein J0S82_003465 [Galemys pyrenaicus]